MAPIIEGGYGNYTYDWVCTGDDSPTLLVVPTENMDCEVIVGDTCGMPSANATIGVTVLEFPVLAVDIPEEVLVLECNGWLDIMANATGGDGVYTFAFEDQDGVNLWGWGNTVSIGTWLGATEVHVTVTDGCGFEATDMVEIDLNVPELIVDVEEEFTTLCNSPFALVASSEGQGPFNYLWMQGWDWLDFDNTLNWTVSEDQTVILEVSDQCGQSTQVEVNIIVDSPDVEISMPAELVGPCTEDFEVDADVVSGSGGYTYSWTQDGENLGENGDVLTVNSMDNTSVTVTVNDGCGQSAMASTDIVIDNPPLVIELGEDIDASCIDNSNILVDIVSGSGDYSFSWTVAGDPYANGSNITVQSFFTVPVFVEIWDGCGGNATDQLMINIPDVPVGMTVTMDATICAGDGMGLEATAVGGEEGFIYYWPTLGQYGPVQYITPTQSGVYPVEATDICGELISDQTEVIVEYLFSDFTASYLTETEVLFHAKPSPEEPFDGAYTFLWNFGDGFTASEPEVTHVYDGMGDYTASLGVTSLTGCTDTSYTVITGPVLMYIPSAFTPNNDGINDAFFVVGDQIKEYEIWIFDRWGETVFHTQDLEEPWIGNVLGADHYAANGIYNWVVRIKGFNTDAEEFRGTVQLMR
jgi:gliding motility-associated-like protein